MAETKESEDPRVEIDALRQRAEDAEARNADLEDAIATVNGIVHDYQQMLADSQLTAATYKSKLQIATGKLSAAAGAQ